MAAVLGDLVRPEHAVVLDTLDAYPMSSGNGVSAARVLSVHAQTMCGSRR